LVVILVILLYSDQARSLLRRLGTRQEAAP